MWWGLLHTWKEIMAKKMLGKVPDTTPKNHNKANGNGKVNGHLDKVKKDTVDATGGSRKDLLFAKLSSVAPTERFLPKFTNSQVVNEKQNGYFGVQRLLEETTSGGKRSGILSHNGGKRNSNYRVSIGECQPLAFDLDFGLDLDLDLDLDEELGLGQIEIQIQQDKWKVLFDKFDPEGFGEIPWPEFYQACKSKEFRSAIEPGKLQLLQNISSTQLTDPASANSAITFQHFINIMSGKRSRSYKCAVHHRDREISSEKDFHLLGYQPISGVKRMARLIADQFLTDERDRKYYADHYRCLPPPLFIISVTLIELGFFTYYAVWNGEISSSGPLPIDSPFVYRPDKRQEIWRFLFYCCLHAGWIHLLFNLLVQLLVGLPLEMVHGSLRIGCIYMAGVLAGSLGTSVFDPDVYLVGASGGVYALLAAHLANVLLNYNNMEFGLVRLLGVFLIASVDVGFAIYDRYAASPPLHDGPITPVSYVAHLGGALAGLTIGLLVLKNFEQKLREQLMWWLALGVYASLTIFAILFNIFHPTYP